MYFRSEFRDTRDTNAAWKVINGLLGREQKLRLPDCFYVSGHLVSDPILIATEFNNIFSNIGSKLAQQFSPTNDFKNYLNENILSRFKLSHVTNQQVTEIQKFVTGC